MSRQRESTSIGDAIASPGRQHANGVCRACGEPLKETFVDLGVLPLCQSYPGRADIERMEPFYPLRPQVCGSCFLVQLAVVVSPAEIFTEYAYFSSYSESWLKHVEGLAESLIGRFGLKNPHLVAEAASNDGYLLQYFQRERIPVLGIEPAANVAKVANEKGVPTRAKFFGTQTAREIVDEGRRAQLFLALNVLDHVPEINDFVAGIQTLLEPSGTAVLEFPYLCRLIEHNEFDTIYHDRFSYLSFGTVESVFARAGLTIFDVEELSTHGGSLRIYARHRAFDAHPMMPSVAALRARETAAGVRELSYYRNFAEQVKETKRQLLQFLIEAKRTGKTVVAYGVPAKGNTLLNYCGIRTDFLDYAVDRSPYKQGKFTPGTHVPIRPVDEIFKTKPDYVLILPWNIKEEIMEQMAGVRAWSGRFVIPIPKVTVC